MISQKLESALEGLVVLIADGNAYTRRLTRQMLYTIGIKAIYETGDGVATVNSMTSFRPDILILDWDMPGLDGTEVMRIVRTPGVFATSGLPAIMLTYLGLESRVTTAIEVGVHEFLIRPISPKMLQQRLFGIIANPRPMIRAGDLYIPMPRRHIDLKDIINVT